jgi:hypothetical protein
VHVRIRHGIRCVGGNLRILYAEHAHAGLVAAPGPGEPTLADASAAHGVPVQAGSPRWYPVAGALPRAARQHVERVERGPRAVVSRPGRTARAGADLGRR